MAQDRHVTTAAGPAERMKMKINSANFRVRQGDKVDLRKWPTKVKPVYTSKNDYHQLHADTCHN